MNIPCDKTLLEQMRSQKIIAGIGPLKGFEYHLDFSVPSIATAIHSGHNVREELVPLIKLSSDQRMFEEDKGTDVMIQGHPNAVWGLDSRAVYDLNRHPDMALPIAPERFWGTQVYKTEPDSEMNKKSLDSYNAFYQFMGTVITHTLELFGYCIVYDIHSYNITRQKDKGYQSPPVFNLGTASLDRSRWKTQIESWLESLRAISLPGIETTVAENIVFSGQGEFCKELCRWDPRILVLPTEVSKVYMDEISGVIYPDVLKAIQKDLAKAMILLNCKS